MRTGQCYIVVADAPVVSEVVRGLGFQSQDSRTPGILVYSLKVPRVLDPQYLRALASLKIGYALRASIEPVGLVPRWDGSTSGTVWLVSEEPLLRLSADCPIKELAVGIDGRADRIPVANRSETIISLGALPIGPHVIASELTPAKGYVLKARSATGAGVRLIRSSFSAPVDAGRASAGWFRVELAPAGASLENLINGRRTLPSLVHRSDRCPFELRTFDFQRPSFEAH